MGNKDSFFDEEKKKIQKAVSMIDDLLAKETLSQYEVIALGTLLQNVYTGIEAIMRYQLRAGGIKLTKNGNWHKNLLMAYRKNDMISDSQFEVLLQLLLFRHMHIHGYGFMLDEERLRALAEPVTSLYQSFFRRAEKYQST